MWIKGSKNTIFGTHQPPNPSFYPNSLNGDFWCLSLTKSYGLVLYVSGLSNRALEILWAVK
jgi:hypothetical protein